MVVVLAVVEADQPILCQALDLSRCRIHHAVYRPLLGKLPVHEQQIREHLNVEKYQWRFLSRRDLPLNIILRLEMHLGYDFQTGLRLIGAAGSEPQDCIPHVIHIIRDVAFICFAHNVGNKVHAWLCIRADLLCQRFLDENAQMLLILDLLYIDHCFFSLQRQATADVCDGNIIALRQFSSQRRFSREHLDFDVFIVDPAELGRITGVNIMQVDARTRFAKLGIGLWPFGSSFKVALKALTPIRAGNIKVNDDVILRDLYIMQLFCIDPG